MPPDKKRKALTPEPEVTRPSKKTATTLKSSSCRPSAKEEARRLDPNSEGDKKICLLTRLPRGHSCHVIPRRGRLMDKVNALRAAWNDDGFTTDCPTNIFTLAETQHAQFDQAMWCLFPHPDELKNLITMYAHHSTTKVSDCITTVYAEKTHFKYGFITSAEMQQDPFARNLLTEPPKLILYPHHRDLGILTSHVYPHFVVVNIADKLVRFPERYAKTAEYVAEIFGLEEEQARWYVEQLQDLYEKWTPVAGASIERGSETGTEYQTGVEDSEGGRGDGGGEVRRKMAGDDPRDWTNESEDGPVGDMLRDTRPPCETFIGANDRQNYRDCQRLSSASRSPPDIIDDTFSCVKCTAHHGDMHTSEDSLAIGKAPNGGVLVGYFPRQHLDLSGLPKDSRKPNNIVCAWLASLPDAKGSTVLELATNAREDNVLREYRLERVRKSRVKSWHTWYPKWRRIGDQPRKERPDTSRFSSNDWAVRECLNLLPGRCIWE